MITISSSSLVVDALSADVRIALRIYFTLILLLVAFIGDRCCSARTRLRLHRSESIPLHRLTGWLSSPRLLAAAWSLRAFPAGWLGGIMLMTGALGLVCDFTVSYLVVTTEVVGRCAFNTTGPYSTVSHIHTNLTEGVMNAGPLYNLVTTAQKTSQLNGGIDGIYWKVNTDLNFRADETDICGQWTCSRTGGTMKFPGDQIPEFIGQKLCESDFMNPSICQTDWDNAGAAGPRGLFVWSAVTTDVATKAWEMHAAVQTGFVQGETEWSMNLYSCSMDAAYMAWMLPLIETEQYVWDFGQIVKSNIFTTDSSMANVGSLPSDPGAVIASYLNAAIMIGGAAWDIEGARVLNSPTQGCLALRCQVPWSVVGLVGVTLLLTLALLLDLIVLSFRVRSARNPNQQAAAKYIDDNAPNGLVSWIRQATKESSAMPSHYHQTPSEGSSRWARAWHFGPLQSMRRPTGLICSPSSSTTVNIVSPGEQWRDSVSTSWTMSPVVGNISVNMKGGGRTAYSSVPMCDMS